MNIDQYVNERIAELESLRGHWKQKQEEAPEFYPEELDSSEWFEQELAFLLDLGRES